VPYKVGGAFTGLEKLPKKEENKMEPRDGSNYLDIRYYIGIANIKKNI